jgi:21S rRNA (uridine2791-2'-O)-methyltransferase
VIDLVIPSRGMLLIPQGFAPGSWTQVAVSKTQPNGRVLGLDILPCAAPPGASAMQGNFLSKATQDRIKSYLSDPSRGRAVTDHDAMIGEEIGYIDMAERGQNEEYEYDGAEKGIADVVLSDMSEPWPQTQGFWKSSLTEAYFRMMNVTGIRVKDHADSMVYSNAPRVS